MAKPYLFDVDSIKSLLPDLGREHPDYVEALLRRADDACDHRFILAGNDPAGSPLDCGRNLDWHSSPNGDREGLFTLNRHAWFFDLARAWFITSDERYSSALMSQWLDWIDACPAPRDGAEHFHDFSPWKVLNAAIRVSDVWLPAYHLLSGSDAWSAATDVAVLQSFHEHGELLAEHVFDTSHNHTIKEMGGLLSLALYFPEFPESNEWRDCACANLERCAADQVLADGVHVEAVPAYHKIAIDWFLRAYAHGTRAGVTFSRDFTKRLESMAAFAYASSFPDGSTVPIGDSDRNALEKWSSDRDYTGRLVERVLPDAPVPLTGGSDPDLLWLTGTLEHANRDGASDASAMPTAFPDGGFFILQDAETYAIVRNGPMNHGHPHADLLSFLLFRNGQLWLTDTGKYTYNETPRRKYLKGTRAHNTVAVDWEDQAAYRDRMSFVAVPQWDNLAWEDTDQYAFYSGSHEGYARLPRPVVHTRQLVQVKGIGMLVVDRFTGDGEHLFDQFFHLPGRSGVELDDYTCRYQQGGDTMHLSWQSSAEGQLTARETWVSPAYGERRDAIALRYRVESAVPAHIITWISFEPDTLRSCVADTGSVVASIRDPRTADNTNAELTLTVQHGSVNLSPEVHT